MEHPGGDCDFPDNHRFWYLAIAMGVVCWREHAASRIGYAVSDNLVSRTGETSSMDAVASIVLAYYIPRGIDLQFDLPGFIPTNPGRQGA